jgi:hypothetical protein
MTHQVPTAAFINDEKDAEQTMMWIFARYPACIDAMLGMLPAKELGLTLKRTMSLSALQELKESLK